MNRFPRLALFPVPACLFASLFALLTLCALRTTSANAATTEG